LGKTTGGSTSTTTYQLSPQQQQIMQGAMGQYMPNGQLPSSAPQFDYNTNGGLQTSGSNFVAPFSTPTLQAFGATEASYGAQQPTMDAAKGLTAMSAGPAGQTQGGPDGWSTNANGQAQYQDYSTGVGKYMSPFVSGVIDTGLGFLDTARQRANMATDSDSISKGSFGGTRQAVRDSLDDTAFAAQAQNLISSNLQSGFTAAQNQYNTGFGQGQQALQYNTGIDQANRAALGAAGLQLGNQAQQNQQITGNDINALGNVGSQIQSEDQAQRDAARAAQLQDNTWGLQVASSLEGLGPPPSSTTNTNQNVSSGSIWGSLGSAAASGLGAMAMASDERVKTDIKDASPEDSLAEIRKLIPKSFKYAPAAQASLGVPGGRRTGFMAQDLERATGKPAPEMGGVKHVDLHEHIGRLTAAVHALDAKMQGKYGSRKAA
jgi:Chaperone of endosialidase